MYGCSSVFDEDTESWVPVSADTLVYPVLAGLAMGWSWALYFCQAMMEAVVGSPPSGLPLIREREVPPAPLPGRAVGAVYAENLNVFGASLADTANAHTRACSKLDALGLALHDVEAASPHYEPVGLVLDLARRLLHRKRRKAWLLRVATQELLDGHPATGRALRAYIGHVQNHFLIVRPALSICAELYRPPPRPTMTAEWCSLLLRG